MRPLLAFVERIRVLLERYERLHFAFCIVCVDVDVDVVMWITGSWPENALLQQLIRIADRTLSFAPDSPLIKVIFRVTCSHLF